MSLPNIKTQPSYEITRLEELKKEYTELLKITNEKFKNYTKKRLRDAKTFGYDDYIPTPRLNEDIHMHGITHIKSTYTDESITLSMINPIVVKPKSNTKFTE